MVEEKTAAQHTDMSSSINQQEIDKFSAMADEWWDEKGKFKPLHQLNPARLEYIKEKTCAHFNLEPDTLKPLTGVKVLDVGCGGGLLCEPLSRLGADVTGIDVAKDSIIVAQTHAQEYGLEIDYQCVSAEELVEQGKSFDLVLNMEVVEHVLDVEGFIKTCASLVNKDGLMVMSTLNRTLKSFALGIVAAEYILKWLPKGTHHWEKFITPDELANMTSQAGMLTDRAEGIVYNPLSDTWSRSNDTAVNYMLCAKHT